MNYASTTVCRADELQAGETVVRLGSVEYRDGLVLSASPLPLPAKGDRHLVVLAGADLVRLCVPADRLAWVSR